MSWVTWIAGAVTLALGASGCTAVSAGGPLSGRPAYPGQVVLSTGGCDRTCRPIGFVQATGFGEVFAGVVEVGDAQFDSTIRGALAEAAARMGGQGVVHIGFLDADPQTPADRAVAFTRTSASAAQGQPHVEHHLRTVEAWGEVVQFAQ